jgi:hypothetical protein
MKAYPVVLALMMLSVGCMQQQVVCNKPYILVGTGCCLDENSDGICDEHKPFCRGLYILVGDSCCLDENRDGICDKDKPPTSSTASTVTTQSSTTTTSVPTTTSTSMPEPECKSIDDCAGSTDINCDGEGRVLEVSYTPITCSSGRCIYRSSKDIGATYCHDWQVCVNGVGCMSKSETTTTTTASSSSSMMPKDYQAIIDRVANRRENISNVMASTTTTILPCFDSDGGLKYDIKSTNVTGFYDYNDSNIRSSSEFCHNSDKLFEYYCESNILRSRIYECTSRCSGGRCCLGESRVCNSDAECCSGLCQTMGMRHYCIS